METHKRRLVYLSILIIFLFIHNIATADTIRKSVYDGQFYPESAAKLRQIIQKLTTTAQKTDINLPDGRPLKAMILPHAGYIYSGWTAAHAVHALTTTAFKKVILIGPDHRIGFKGCALSNVAAYQTPFGNVPIHSDAAVLKSNTPRFEYVPASDQAEHSLEVILPFLQYYIKSFDIIPIVMGVNCSPHTLANDLRPLLDPETLIVASSDLSHFLSYGQAVATDTDTINKILQQNVTALARKSNAACGINPILCLIALSKQLNWEPILLHYSNSGDTHGDKERVVGYAAIAFYGGQTMQTIENKYGNALVRLARQTIAKKLGKPTTQPETLSTDLKHETLQTQRGTFVTLKIDGQLRGCIGNLSPSESIVEGVRRNALNAALKDYRFTPLTPEELENVTIEVSVLTEPQPLSYTDANDLLKKLRPNIDGVILKKGMSSATFLPQVWEQLPDPKAFLSHLCSKAGMSPDQWKKTGLTVLTYQVQYFEEEE